VIFSVTASMNSSPNVCPRCDRVVYAAEQAMGPARKLYHKGCLSCLSCKKALLGGAVLEHDEEAYCRNCHIKLFSTQDLRSGNLPSTPIKAPSTPSTPTLSPSRPPSNPSPQSLTPPPRNRALPNNFLFATPTGSSPPGPAQPITPFATGGSPGGSPRFRYGGQRVECPTCRKAVYHAEQVLAVGKKWHRGCLVCGACSKRLDSGNVSDKDGVPYCRPCYSKNHGPAGAGYALMGKPGA